MLNVVVQHARQNEENRLTPRWTRMIPSDPSNRDQQPDKLQFRVYITLRFFFLQTARTVIAARVANRRRNRTRLLRLPRHRLGRFAIHNRRLLDQHGDSGAGREPKRAMAEDCKPISFHVPHAVKPCKNYIPRSKLVISPECAVKEMYVLSSLLKTSSRSALERMS